MSNRIYIRQRNVQPPGRSQIGLFGRTLPRNGSHPVPPDTRLLCREATSLPVVSEMLFSSHSRCHNNYSPHHLAKFSLCRSSDYKITCLRNPFTAEVRFRSLATCGNSVSHECQSVKWTADILILGSHHWDGYICQSGYYYIFDSRWQYPNVHETSSPFAREP
jgi:hypothetical protein